MLLMKISLALLFGVLVGGVRDRLYEGWPEPRSCPKPKSAAKETEPSRASLTYAGIP